MHSFVASKIWPELQEYSISDIKKVAPDKRQAAKSAGFAINYGGNGYTIANNLNISREDGEDIYEGYMDAFPGLSNYFKSVKKDALENGYILFNNVTNRKHFLYKYPKYKELAEYVESPGFWDEYRFHKNQHTEKFVNYYKPLVKEYFYIKGDIERCALNYPVQGTSSDITKLAGIYFFKWILEKGYFNKVMIVNIVHDEFVAECLEELAEEVSNALKLSMEKAGELFCELVALKATPVISKLWNH